MKWLLFVAFIAQAHAQYIEGRIIGIPKLGPTQQNPVIFVNNMAEAYDTSGKWYQVDVSQWVPKKTKAIRLDGIMIITHGSTPALCNLTAAFRARHDDWDHAYIMQTAEASTEGGQRSNGGTWVALDENRRFEMKWVYSPQGQWPEHCAFGMNLSLTAYLR